MGYLIISNPYSEIILNFFLIRLLFSNKVITMESKKDKNQEKGIEKSKEDLRGSDADVDKGITDGKFSNIGLKQAGDNNIEEEIKGSDADKSV